jgi:PD-(D/E)XK nuclease superfamily
MHELENADSGQNLQALERFVVENDDLLSLESRIGRFNIFEALGIAHAEIRHSNFLAFILDPRESHGQSHLFLSALLMDLLKIAPEKLRPLSPIEIDGIDLRGVEVRREWNSIDLLITSQQPPFVIVLENKIWAGEHSNQLGRYKETIRRYYADARPLYVFLTPDRSNASDDEWVSYGYADLHRILSRVRTTYQNAIGDDVLIFLEHYLNLIGTRFMNDKQIDELCHRIYKNHRQALQLIYERVGSPSSGVIAEVEACLRDDSRYYVFYRSGNIVDFVPVAWLAWMPPIGLDVKDQPQSWFVLRFEAYPDERKLDFFVEVRRIADLARRRALVQMLLQEGEKFGFMRKQKSEVKVKDSYTRVSSRERVITWPEDQPPDDLSIRAAVVKKLSELLPKLDGLPDAMRKILQGGN